MFEIPKLRWSKAEFADRSPRRATTPPPASPMQLGRAWPSWRWSKTHPTPLEPTWPQLWKVSLKRYFFLGWLNGGVNESIIVNSFHHNPSKDNVGIISTIIPWFLIFFYSFSRFFQVCHVPWRDDPQVFPNNPTTAAPPRFGHPVPALRQSALPRTAKAVPCERWRCSIDRNGDRSGDDLWMKDGWKMDERWMKDGWNIQQTCFFDFLWKWCFRMHHHDSSCKH